MADKPHTSETLASNLRMLMSLHDPPLNQAALEKLSGVSQKTISNMLTPGRPGSKSHNLEKVERVAAAFGLTAWHLLIPTLPDDIKECHRISELVDDYIVTPKDSRDLIYYTAERERKLTGSDD